MEEVTLYMTRWCADCRSVKRFLRERGVEFSEINVDEEPDAEDLVLEIDQGLRKVPTIEVGERYFACSPFDPYQLASELDFSLNT